MNIYICIHVYTHKYIRIYIFIYIYIIHNICDMYMYTYMGRKNLPKTYTRECMHI